MKRLLLGLIVGSVLAAAVVLSATQGPTPSASDLQITVEGRNPWTHLRLNNDPSEFRFAIVSDRTGGHRARVFSQAVQQLNLLQPEFVLSVGDLIEGYTEDPEKLAAEWKEFQGYASQLQMPFFYVPGNHDVTNLFQEKAWKEKFGRRYYCFVYKQVLFLILNSDDPPGKVGSIGPEQIAFVKETLEKNAAVRHTIAAVHRPLWDQPNLEKNGWLEVERLLADRPYTVFAGHIHRYRKFVRQGRNYYQLATTGGGSKMRGLSYGEFDHIAWVTMKKDGPVIANVLLDGVLPEDLRRPVTDEAGVLERGRRATYPVHGQALIDGTPATGTMVVFHLIEGEGKKPIRAGDALVEADGSFTLSTYTANDGAPVGTYIVTVAATPPYFEEPHRTAPKTPVPEKYGKPDTSPLRVTVKEGKNDFTLEIRRD
jgi:serine/threonine-protein phosphatase CPPED1